MKKKSKTLFFVKTRLESLNCTKLDLLSVSGRFSVPKGTLSIFYTPQAPHFLEDWSKTEICKLL